MASAYYEENGIDTDNKKDILKGIVFALSGFIDHERCELRNLALKLGALYRPEWNKDCSHLM